MSKTTHFIRIILFYVRTDIEKFFPSPFSFFFYSNQIAQKKMSRKVNILPYQKYRPITKLLAHFYSLGKNEKKIVTFGIIRIFFVLKGITHDSSAKFST